MLLLFGLKLHDLTSRRRHCGSAFACFVDTCGDDYKTMPLLDLQMLQEMKMLQCRLHTQPRRWRCGDASFCEFSQRWRCGNAFAGFADACGDEDVMMPLLASLCSMTLLQPWFVCSAFWLFGMDHNMLHNIIIATLAGFGALSQTVKKCLTYFSKGKTYQILQGPKIHHYVRISVSKIQNDDTFPKDWVFNKWE